MARIRSLKPDFFRSRTLARVSREARLTFQGLWCEADDVGNGIADPRILKGAVWPLDDDLTHEHVARHLDELEQVDAIRRYEVDGHAYYTIPAWSKHQSAAFRRGAPKHPPAPDGVQLARESVQPQIDDPARDPSLATDGVQVARGSVLEGKGEGGEQGGDPGGGVGDDAEDLARLLARWRHQNGDKPVDNLQPWTRTFVAMMQRDKRDPDDIERVLVWSQRDTFWRTTVLTPDDLRKHYDKLDAKRRAEGAGSMDEAVTKFLARHT